MKRFFSKTFDKFFGRGEESIFVPPMDGPLKPNEMLDKINVIRKVPEVDNLCNIGKKVICSSGSDLLEINKKITLLKRFTSKITSIAFHKETQQIAVAIHEGRILIINTNNFEEVLEIKQDCVTSMCYSKQELFLTVGSSKFSTEDWQSDLMTLGGTGCLMKCKLSGSRPEKILDNLSWPSGVLISEANLIFLTESWKHRIRAFKFDESSTSPGEPSTILEKLPAYPGRIFSDKSKDQIWVAFFAPRNQLVEFVLTETEYREKMIASVDKEYWVSPCLRSGKSIKEPLQYSGIKTMGYLKPWAPAFSYGLFVKYDNNLNAIQSYHSRTNGFFHGTNSLAIDKNGKILVSSTGDGKIGYLNG